MGDQVAAAKLTDWRHLAQGLHARYLVEDFAAAARFVDAAGACGDDLHRHLSLTIGNGYIDLKVVSPDAIYRDHDGMEYVVEWVTQADLDIARRLSDVAADHHLMPEPAAVSTLELGLDTRESGAVAPVWAALLTGDANAQGRGTPSDEIRDATDRVPHLWFGDLADDSDEPQRFHIEVYVPPEVAVERVKAALLAGGTVVDDSQAPSLVVIADPEGNKGVLCTRAPATSDG